MKKLFRNQENLVILGFASYSTYKVNSFIVTPYAFPNRSYNHVYLNSEETVELYKDFVERTVINFIRNKGNFPKPIQDVILKITKGHVGFISAIIHFINMRCQKCTNTDEILLYVASPDLMLLLMSQRDWPSFDEVKDEKTALHTLWNNGPKELPLTAENKEPYMSLVRKGWLALSNDASSVSFICPLSQQIILNKLHLHLSRPSQDSFMSLADFF